VSFRPGDFFLSVVSFLGALVPGAVFGMLLLAHSTSPTWTQWADWKPAQWAAFAVVAYILGQLLLAVSDLLNATADPMARVFTPKLYRKVQEAQRAFQHTHADLARPEKNGEGVSGETKERLSGFHAALSFVRLRSAEAAAEVDHHMADYKLLRNLVIALLVDAAVSIVIRPRYPRQQLWEIILAALAFYGFIRMYNWARYFAFDYALLLSRPLSQSKETGIPESPVPATKTPTRH